ncbi:TPA_asm: Cro (control of repressor's operator) [Mycobacterium phage prophiFVLQ01-1]|nr:TPA_asm: Cro (control of repressor's operator) [Mycobacterium phage prophiFVLQ01-1]
MAHDVRSVEVKNLPLLRSLVGPEPEKLMTARNLAQKVGKHPSFIGHLLSGDPERCRTFSVEVAQAISVALGVKMSNIFQPATSITRQRSNNQQAS